MINEKMIHEIVNEGMVIPLDLLVEILAAIVGTVAFSVLFGVPRRYYRYCGLIGGAGWAVYCVFSNVCDSPGASLAATMVVIFLSRLMAVRERCPATIFLISGIFPLVPGAGVYWTAYYIVTEQLWKAVQTGYLAVKIAVAIVLGIVFIFELPQGLFLSLAGHKRSKAEK
ncbi:MAG: threonine/serine exporter family protein [Lachnospiraceae bacterium]|nr:threonine/serine exporter family protein [Lachnospiraceae bacterium]MDO5551763.1 threonine/serine exporter family protein [Lachnospiraceae bacterium]